MIRIYMIERVSKISQSAKHLQNQIIFMISLSRVGPTLTPEDKHFLVSGLYPWSPQL